MTGHAFLINCHTETDQALRLVRLLREYFRDDSQVFVHLDGPGYDPTWLSHLHKQAAVLRGDHEPDKCKGILKALSALAERARQAQVEVASLLHPDMIPTDRQAWRTFLRRFAGSTKAMTYAPVWPLSEPPSFCCLHWKPDKASNLFPTQVFDWPGINEAHALASWSQSWPEWKQHAYPMAILNYPHSTCPEGGPMPKVMHGPGYAYVVHDYCPESSVIHTNDPSFWEHYEQHVRL